MLRRKQLFCSAAYALSLFLLVCACLGSFTSLGDYESSKPRDWERFDPALLSRTPSYDSLLREAERRAGRAVSNLSPAQSMEALYVTIVDRYTFGPGNHNIFSNWILWTLGKLNPTFAHIRDKSTLVSKGHSIFCGQASFLLMSLANDIGIRSRHIGLNGHVVMEAFYDGGWHLYDPDLEVVAKNAFGKVLSLSELMEDQYLLGKAYGGPKIAAIPLILTTEDNTFMTYPPGTWFTWKSQVLYLAEKVANYLKYLVPLSALLIGLVAARRKR